MTEGAVAIAAITLAGALATGFFGLVSKQDRTHQKIAKGLEDLAKATKDGNREAKQRNGHLAELIVSTADNIKASLNKPVNVQTVETQVVKEQR